MDILSALAAFASYFFSGFAMILVFLFVYTASLRTTNGR